MCSAAKTAAMDKTRHRSEARFDEQQGNRMTTGIPVEDWIAHHAPFGVQCGIDRDNGQSLMPAGSLRREEGRGHE
jgi:hypothetical protein